MKIRRTISIDKNDLATLKPILDSNGNNLSLAIRQLIDNYRQEHNFKKISSDQQREIMLRNKIIENKVASLIPIPLVKWLVKRSLGVPPLGTFRGILEKYPKLLGISGLTLEEYVKSINTHGEIFGYQITQQTEMSPDHKNIRISFETEDPEHLKGSVISYSCLLAHHPLNLKTKKVIVSPSFIIIDYEQCNSEEEAYRSVMDHFGYNQMMMDEILNNIEFWRRIVHILKADNYQDIVVSRDIFLQLFKSHDFSDELCSLITMIYSVSIECADCHDITKYISEICETNGLIIRIEHNENEIKIYHRFNEINIINIVNNTIIRTLEMSGHNFVLKKSGKVTLFNRM
jgi:hypothetical protein